MDAHAESVALPNRITLPLLRVQERKWLLAAVDATLAAGWLMGAYTLWRAAAHPAADNMAQMPWAWVVAGTAVWLLISWFAASYELDVADHLSSSSRATLIVGMVAALLAFAAYYGFLKTFPRPALALALVGMPVSVLAWRGLYVALLRRPASATRLLVVGDASLYESLSAATAEQRGYYQIVGYVSEGDVDGAQHLGTPDRLAEIATRFRVHRIVVAPRQSLAHAVVAALSTCIERGLEIVDFSAAYEEITGKVAVEHAGDYWMAALPTRPGTTSVEEVAIRLLDVVGALFGLALTLIAALPLAAAIYLESGWPVVYRQERLGRGGRLFTLLKFRSMRTDAEAGGARWAGRDDERATTVGRFLRRTHLDELPQMWNILRGDMSLVGPRPERAVFTDSLAKAIPFYRLRLAVRPGLTGLKQIRVGYAATPEEHLEVLRHDLYFIKHRSLALNLLILARTVGSVLGMDGR